MHRFSSRLFLVVCACLLAACDPLLAGPDAGTSEGGSSLPAHDASTPAVTDAATTEPLDAGSSTPTDGGPGHPDAGSTEEPPPDGGSGCDDCTEPRPDLVIELGSADEALAYRNVVITEDDCELYEGCIGGEGPRVLLELSFELRNVGGAAIELGRPFENPLYYPSFCQDSYVLDGFFKAELRDDSGAVAAQGWLSTSCIAGSDGYTCRAQGLGVDDGSTQPIGRCDFLDVTSVRSGHYTLVIRANPDHVIDESDFDNNSAELEFDYEACEGTLCGSTCCPEGVGCAGGQCMLPDLRINQESAAQSLFITHQTFDDDSCELEEMCVNGSGRRRLLEFEGRIENWGPADLSPGVEADNPLFEFSECHEHYHFREFTDYRLLDADGNVAAFGHKQSFCLVSMVQVEGAPPTSPIGVRPPPGETGCNLLLAGWADIYGVGTPCQWVDITDVPPGDYVLQLTVNPGGQVPEVVTDNNTVQVPVHIEEDVPCEEGAVEICGDNIDQDCDDQPDDWDSDCQVCYPGDPWCETTIQVSGNGTCAEAYEMVEQATFATHVSSTDAGEVALACGGEGGDVFFSFTLDSEQVVYLGTLSSELDTVLALYRDGCDGEALRCEDDSCTTPGGQFIDVLPAGHYVAVVKAKLAGRGGSARLKFQHADLGGATVLQAPGVYAGDTSSSDDSTLVCDQYYPPYPGGGADAGVSGEECVDVATASGTSFSHDCLHCACDADAAAISACDAMCWDLIDCAIAECGGGDDVACVSANCPDFIDAAATATTAGAALRECPMACGVDPGTGIGGAGSAGTGAPDIDGGMSGSDGGVYYDPGISLGGRDDIYVVAACQYGMFVSTCGTSEFASVIDVRSGSLDGPMQACSAGWGDYCQGDALGAAVSTYSGAGLTFIVIDGMEESAAGAYQMSVTY